MKTPEEMYYEWRQAFDESLDERMCKGEPIELQLLHQELGKETFLAGYKAAKELYAAKLKEANDTVAGMADECEGLKTIIYDHDETNLLTPAKWISVKERLPEMKEVALVFSKSTYLNVAHRVVDDKGWCWSTPSMSIAPHEITHWMPLPEAPKEEK